MPLMRLFAAWVSAFAVLLCAAAATAADFAISFGIKTPSGYGASCTAGLAPGLMITGTGAADWAQDAAGCIIPAGTYGVTKISGAGVWSKTAGQTYNLTFGGVTTVDITLVAARYDISSISTDTTSSNQLRTLGLLAYTDTRAFALGDAVYLRAKTFTEWGGAGTSWNLPVAGYKGAGTITNAGVGCTPGTYTNLAATGGTGTGALLVVTVVSGTVRAVHVNDPGTGYLASDVISAAVPGCTTAFSYTVIDLAARITIRSETPNEGTDADGNPTRGGSATIGGLRFGGTAVRRSPFKIMYLNVLKTGPTAYGASYMLGQSTTGAYGSAYLYNRVENVGPFTVNPVWSGIQSAMGEVGYNRILNQKVGIVQGGYGATPGTYPPVANIVSYIHHNVITGSNKDAIDLAGLNLRVEYNLALNFNTTCNDAVPPECSHSDGIQHFGFAVNAYPNWPDNTTFPNFGYIGKNIILRGGPINPSQLGSQSVFMRGGGGGNNVITGATIENNIGLTGFGNGVVSESYDVPTWRFNQTIGVLGPTIPPNAYTTKLYAYSGVGGTFDRNMSNVADFTTQTGAIVTNGCLIPYALATYQAVFPNYDAEPLNWDEAIASMTPVNATLGAYGPRLADGTFCTALFPDGTFNDGTVFGQTPATALTSLADTLSVQAGQPVTITVQANAAATLAITATPAVAGVTGGFSPATAVIATDEVSAQTVFTPTSAGTASVTFTNNRSLTNPAALVITVTAAPIAPTSYTQVADRTVVPIAGSVTVTYTLNHPATQAVTLTPGVSGVNGVFSVANVVIPVDQTVGSVTFFPSGAGAATLTVTDDRGLTDPVGLAITVVRATRGQLCSLGLCNSANDNGPTFWKRAG